MGKKEIKYRTPSDGNKTETVENADSVSCVGDPESGHKEIIVQHTNDQDNTVIRPVTDLFKVEDK